MSRTSPIRVLQLTDFHLRAQSGGTLLGVDTEHSFAGILSAALNGRHQPAIALLTGDLVQDAEPAAYRRLKSLLSPLPCPAYCLPGNHDDPALIADILAGGRIHCQPRILLNNWQIVCLDSTIPHSPRGRLADAQLDLLDKLLGERPEHFALIALHHHPLPCGSAWMDTMVLENSNAFFGVLSRHPQVRGVVFGHVHQAMDTVYQGLRILGAPSTCFQFKPLQAEFKLDPIPSGYRWLELHEDGTIISRIRRLDALPEGLDVDSGGY